MPLHQSDIVKRRAARLLVRVGAVLSLAFIVLLFYLITTGPHHANPVAGETIRFGSRGNHTFHTARQMLSLGILGGAALVLFIAASALGWPFSDGTYEKVRATYQSGTEGDDV